MEQQQRDAILEAIKNYMDEKGEMNGEVKIGTTTITLAFQPYNFRCECGETFKEARKMKAHRDGLPSKEPSKKHLMFEAMKKDAIKAQKWLDDFNEGKGEEVPANPNDELSFKVKWSWDKNMPYENLKKKYVNTTFNFQQQEIINNHNRFINLPDQILFPVDPSRIRECNDF